MVWVGGIGVAVLVMVIAAVLVAMGMLLLVALLWPSTTYFCSNQDPAARAKPVVNQLPISVAYHPGEINRGRLWI